jgi:3-dehydroquinate dehydratase-2
MGRRVTGMDDRDGGGEPVGATGEVLGAAMRDVLVLNGPNLSRLGTREPDVYGAATYDDLSALCREAGRRLGLHVEVRETSDEAELIDWLHEAADGRHPIVLNPAAFTHYSYAVRDAIAQRTAPLIEVHISNPAAREEFRHTSVVAGVATGTIAGFGLLSYVLALQAIAELLAEEGEKGEQGEKGEKGEHGQKAEEPG